ncbi:MAG TPA: hypothetical protein VH913_05210 [Hyphomicrobiaceae bacterium]
MTLVCGHIYVVWCSYARPQPKEKLYVCFCDQRSLFFFINTKAALLAEAQVALAAADHPALTHDCFLDLSQAVTFPPQHLAAAQDRGPISADLTRRVRTALEAGIKTLPKQHLAWALQTLVVA